MILSCSDWVVLIALAAFCTGCVSSKSDLVALGDTKEVVFGQYSQQEEMEAGKLQIAEYLSVVGRVTNEVIVAQLVDALNKPDAEQGLVGGDFGGIFPDQVFLKQDGEIILHVQLSRSGWVYAFSNTVKWEDGALRLNTDEMKPSYTAHNKRYADIIGGIIDQSKIGTSPR